MREKVVTLVALFVFLILGFTWMMCRHNVRMKELDIEVEQMRVPAESAAAVPVVPAVPETTKKRVW